MAPVAEGALVTRVELNPRKGYILRYPPEEFERELPARRINHLGRRGKHLVFETELARGGEPRSLVVNPMLGGRFQLADDDTPVPATHVFTLRLSGGREIRYLDFRDMGRIYWTDSPERDVPVWADLGPEANAIGGDGFDAFRKRLRRYRDHLKDLLQNQAFVAGIGNAYSDEILWAAQLLPLRKRASLSTEEEAALYEAIPATLADATKAILANPKYTEEKQDRTFMAVHMKGGQSCRRCGHRISQLGSNREPTNFCRGCPK